MDFFITSDTFFGRKNAIKLGKRPFETVEEMDNALIENWNSVVGENDVVFHLGNFAWTPEAFESAIGQLKGSIIFMKGDYDQALTDGQNDFDWIKILSEQIYCFEDAGIVMSHWPLADWPGRKKGVYHFHGHTLRSTKTDIEKMNRVNICCDNWNYRPQKIIDLIEMFEDFKRIKEEKS